MTARVIWLCACVLPRLWVGVRVSIAVTVCYLRLLNSHLECFLSASKIAIFFSVCYATNRLPHARVTKQKTVKLNLTALVFTHVKLTISYLIHIENHCAHIYSQ